MYASNCTSVKEVTANMHFLPTQVSVLQPSKVSVRLKKFDESLEVKVASPWSMIIIFRVRGWLLDAKGGHHSSKFCNSIARSCALGLSSCGRKASCINITENS